MQKNLAPRLTYTRIIVLGLLAIILLGTLLLSLPISSRTGEWTPFIDSLFTATTSACVTGLIVYDTYTHWSLFGQLVILFLIQIGGLGFMTIITMIFIFFRKKITLRERLVIRQSAGSISVGGVVLLVKKVALGTLIFEGLGAVLLALRFCPDMGFWRGVQRAVSPFRVLQRGIDLWANTGVLLTAYASDPLVMLIIASLTVIGELFV